MSGKEYDSSQRAAIGSDVNTVVSAGAGSGKTSVLAERFVRLVREGKAGVDTILTLTFTRKAAAEMHERIYTLLTAEPDESVQLQVTRFHRAQISTIDSFCASVVRSWPERFGITRDFSLDDERVHRTMTDTSLEFLLANWEKPGLHEFLKFHGFYTVWMECFVPLATDYITLAETKNYRSMLEDQLVRLKEKTAESVHKMEEIAAQVLNLEEKGRKTISNARQAFSSFPDCTSLLESKSYATILEALLDLHITLPGRVKDPDLILLKDILVEARDLREELIVLADTLNRRELLEGMFSLCHDFEDMVTDKKRREGILSFHDVLQMAVTALRENRDLRNYYKCRFSHIMIDEFQDNNMLQKELLYLLAEDLHFHSEDIPEPGQLEKNKLFFVGDEKQSIYRFRGADVSVFKSLKEEIRKTGGTMIELLNNYRSEPELIDFYNLVFPEIMANPEKPFEAEFIPLEARQGRVAQKPEITLLYKPLGQEEDGTVSGDDAEAYRIAERIRDMVEQEQLVLWDEQISARRSVTYSDIALLMRSTSNQIRYERAFRMFGIPYVTEGIRSLFLEAPVNDIYAALQTALYPEDKFAAAAYLRSPFCPLSDDVVIRVLAGWDGEGSDSGLNPDEREQYQRSKEVLVYIRSQADAIPIARLLSRLWYRFGYRYFLLKKRNNHSFLEYFDYLLELARTFDERGDCLAVFLDFLRENLGKYERIQDISILRESSSGVQILTIHRSKGLEFPVVFLCNTGNTGAAASTSPYYLSEEYGLTFSIPGLRKGGKKRENYFFTAGERENREKELAELKRLLYVAVTRAQHHLFISGCHNKRNARAEGVHLNMLLPVVRDLPDVERVCRVDMINDVTDQDFKRQGIRRDDTDLDDLCRKYSETETVSRDFPVTHFMVTDIRPPAEVEEDSLMFLPELAVDQWLTEREEQAGFGILCHEIIERMIRGTYSEGLLPESLKDRFSHKHLPVLLKEGEALAEAFFKSSLGQHAVRADFRVSETPFLLLWEEASRPVTISGRIDLLFKHGDELYIIDFKTDRVFLPEEHEIQMILYMRGVKEMTGSPVKGFLYYLRGGEITEVVETPESVKRISQWLQ